MTAAAPPQPSDGTSPAGDSFPQHMRRAAGVARDVFKEFAKGEADEQAGPAYLEGNLLSRWVFWSRLAKVERLLPPGKQCLDFGCGFGLLLPWLSRRFEQVYALDIEPKASRLFLSRWPETQNEPLDNVRLGEDFEALEIEPGTLDAILALDVLEHVDNLDELLQRFHSLLRPGGTLIVSGPTENFFYKLGRRIVGFSGDYHVRDVDAIENSMRQSFDVRLAGRVLYPINLFHLLTATPKEEVRGPSS